MRVSRGDPKAIVANFPMRRHGGLWQRIVEKENIELAYARARRGKSKLRGVINFERDEARNLERVRQCLLDKTFHTAHYTEHTVFEPKQRTIYALPFSPDRIVQHALMNVLAPIWTPLFIRETYACIEGRGVHTGSRKCMEYARTNRYCLQSDVSKFYPSVNHEIMKAIVRKKIKCADTLWLLDDIIDSFPGETNVPIGNLTSQWLGNLYLNELDQYARHALKLGDYMRYCDDFLAFDGDKSRLSDARDAMTAFCSERLQLSLKKAEIFPTSQGIDFLGYRHFPRGYLLLRKRTARRLRNKLEAPGFSRRSIEYRRSFLASVKGWASHANCKNFNRATRLDEQFEAVRYAR